MSPAKPVAEPYTASLDLRLPETLRQNAERVLKMPILFWTAIGLSLATTLIILSLAPTVAVAGWLMRSLLLGGLLGFTMKAWVENPRWYPFLVTAAVGVALGWLYLGGPAGTDMRSVAAALLPAWAFAAGIFWPGRVADPFLPNDQSST